MQITRRRPKPTLPRREKDGRAVPGLSASTRKRATNTKSKANRADNAEKPKQTSAHESNTHNIDAAPASDAVLAKKGCGGPRRARRTRDKLWVLSCVHNKTANTPQQRHAHKRHRSHTWSLPARDAQRPRTRSTDVHGPRQHRERDRDGSSSAASSATCTTDHSTPQQRRAHTKHHSHVRSTHVLDARSPQASSAVRARAAQAPRGQAAE